MSVPEAGYSIPQGAGGREVIVLERGYSKKVIFFSTSEIDHNLAKKYVTAVHCFKEESCSYFSHSSKLLRFTWQGTCQAGKQIQNTFLNGPFLFMFSCHSPLSLSPLLTGKEADESCSRSVKSTGWKILNPFLASESPRLEPEDVLS